MFVVAKRVLRSSPIPHLVSEHSLFALGIWRGHARGQKERKSKPPQPQASSGRKVAESLTRDTGERHQRVSGS